MAQSLGGLSGEVRVVPAVPPAYAELLSAAIADSAASPFVLACSGGGSGSAVLEAAIARGEIDWSRVAIVFVDERCVPPDSPDANERSLREALGPELERLAGFHPMRCSEGAASYEAVLRRYGHLDLVQLGFGPDGHTASLFPGSAALDVDDGRLVVENEDPSGRNVHPRLTLTLAGIAMSQRVVVTVVGAEKADALDRLRHGADLPAGRVRADELVWLVEAAAWEGAGA